MKKNVIFNINKKALFCKTGSVVALEIKEESIAMAIFKKKNQIFFSNCFKVQDTLDVSN